jgi:lipopolysaccharide/colanic/teichoic acid biosynthesis glycosyltransferase
VKAGVVTAVTAPRFLLPQNPGASTQNPRCRVGRVAKRTVDIVVAGGLLVGLSPLLLIVAVLIRRGDRGPVLFRQERVGYQDGCFTMLKFRSMSLGSDDLAHRELVQQELSSRPPSPSNGSYKLAGDPRITPVGGWLRRSSLDELPQLVNVLRGEMSLVGPRPALPWEVPLYPPEYRRRTAVRPGITGLWQVSGRSRITTVEMLQHDVRYVDTGSLWLDLRILLLTVPTVLRGDGAR